MDFITNAVTKGFWNSLAELASDCIKAAIDIIIDCVVSLSDVNKYINTSEYLSYVYAIAGGLLIVNIIYQGMKSQTGLVQMRSLSELTMRTVFGAAGIYVLPWSFMNIMIPLNNFLMYAINSIGQEITAERLVKMLVFDLTGGVSGFVILMGLIWSIALIVFGIAGGIRHIELIITTLIAPIMSVSLIKGNEGCETWFKEAICIVFTQSVHMLLLKLLINICTQTSGLIMVILTIGIVAIAIRGPQVIRNYMYSSGVGSTGVGAVGGGVRMMAMSRMFSAANPVSA